MMCVTNNDCPQGCRCANGNCVPVSTYLKLSNDCTLYYTMVGTSKFKIYPLKIGQFIDIYGKRIERDDVLVHRPRENQTTEKIVIKQGKELELCRSEDPVLVDIGYELILDKIKSL